MSLEGPDGLEELEELEELDELEELEELDELDSGLQIGVLSSGPCTLAVWGTGGVAPIRSMSTRAPLVSWKGDGPISVSSRSVLARRRRCSVEGLPTCPHHVSRLWSRAGPLGRNT